MARKATTTRFRSIAWSPDSKKLVAYRTRPGYDRQVHYVESSPADQLQPKHYDRSSTASPATRWTSPIPALFDVATKKQIEIDQRALPECLQPDAPGVAEGQPRLHLRVQPARPPGLSRHRSGRADRQGARADRRSRARPSSTTTLWARASPAAAATATMSTTARKSSGCRSATAGIICTSTTASPAR